MNSILSPRSAPVLAWINNFRNTARNSGCIQRFLHATWYTSFKGNIPRDEIVMTAMRSGGPGGQNVNKLNTKVMLKFNVHKANWLSDHAKEQLLVQQKNRINKAGELIVTSSKTRSQVQNQEDAYRLLTDMCTKAAVPPAETSEEAKQRVRKLSAIADKRREQKKRRQSDQKKLRKKNFRFDQ
eukprot:m.879973 g.879973  ORF g.879973 m.879973 type:complete len:183 (-) comp23589_c0_seq4:2-550(-)